MLAAFFKVNCPTCQYTFPFLERLYQQLGPNRAQICGISQDGIKDSQRFARDYAVTFPMLIDDYPYRISREYGLEYVPSIFLIAPDGVVTKGSEGFSKRDLLEIKIPSLERSPRLSGPFSPRGKTSLNTCPVEGRRARLGLSH